MANGRGAGAGIAVGLSLALVLAAQALAEHVDDAPALSLLLPPPAAAAAAGEGVRVPGELQYAVLEDGRLAAWYAVDGHLHSEVSGDSKTTLRDLVGWGVRRRLDAMVVTDHNSVGAARVIAALDARRSAGERPLLVLGDESGVTDSGHVGLWNVTAHTRVPKGGHDLPALGIVRAAAERDAASLAVLNHPGWGEVSGHLWRSEYFDPRLPGPKFDAIELWNGRLLLQHQTRRLIGGWEDMLARGLRPSIVASSDAHHGFNAGAPHTVVLAAALDAAHLVEGVRAGRTYLTDDARVAFTIDGRVPGESVPVAPDEAPLRLRVAGTSDKGGTLRILERRALLLAVEVVPGPFEVDLDWSPAAGAGDGWVRVEIVRREPWRGEDIDFVGLVTAPIYWDATPYGDFWCDLPGVWRDRAVAGVVAATVDPLTAPISGAFAVPLSGALTAPVSGTP